MKKLLVIAIAAFAFSACNNAKTNEGTAGDTTKPAAEVTPVTPENNTPPADPNAPAQGTTPAPAEGNTPAAAPAPAPAADKAAH
jgi:hypothetical protein